ncbi:MAG: class I SAM-dependent methyltransferase [Candidatus Absconditabacterales bacterium]
MESFIMREISDQTKQNIMKQNADKKRKESGSCPMLFWSLKSDPSASTSENIIEFEIESLKKGNIPNDIIYSGIGKDMLNEIDNNLGHIYSWTVNEGIRKIFNTYGSEFSYYKKLRECLGQTEERIDIGTGNGIVSNHISFLLHMSINMARIDKMAEYIKSKSPELYQITNKKVHFTSCDLSKDSLDHAYKIAKNHFFQLEKLFDLDYYHGDFEKLMKSKDINDAKLITMFNMLANFEYNDLKNILTKVYNSLGEKDVFIPTFFNVAKEDNFYDLTKALYNNKETMDRLVNSFCDRYSVSKNIVIYDVDFNNDGRLFIDITLSIPPNTILNIPHKSGCIMKVMAKDMLTPSVDGLVKFNILKSYRMSEEEIKKVCKEVGFKIDGILYSDDNLQIVPLLYK